jgi:hypothetical protein
MLKNELRSGESSIGSHKTLHVLGAKLCSPESFKDRLVVRP